MDCACTLKEADMMQRVTAWQEVSARAISRRVEANRITSVYPSDPQLLTRLQDLITAEGMCCSFLKFTIDAKPHETVVQLTYPEAARGLIEAIMTPEDGRHEPQTQLA